MGATRVAMRRALISAVQDCLRRHGSNCQSATIRDYLRPWEKAQEIDRCALRARNFWEYFSRVLEFPVLDREPMTGQPLIYNDVRPFAALLSGYGGLHHFDDFYARRKNRATCSGNSTESDDQGDAA
jgi:hypothetical protein